MKTVESWGCFISMTGTEVIDIGKRTGFLPSLLVTNRITKISEKNLETLGKYGVIIKTIPLKPTLEDYLSPEILEKRLITLHGFLRIVPEGFFPQFKGEMYNGHPGLITVYPELKGFNKQEDIAGNHARYPMCGSVIHRVIPELDSGEVIISAVTINTSTNIDEAYSLLRTTSLKSWGIFFESFWKFD